MPYWLIYKRCPDCGDGSCLQCRENGNGQEMTLHVVQADEQPENSLNGPCGSPEEILGRMGRHFEFDATGRMRFKGLEDDAG